MTDLLAMTATGFFSGVGYFLFALLCLMFMIVVHEVGHMVAGRLLGFKIDEFAVGFGPAIIKFTSKKSLTKYALRCIPLGGYCAFYGEEGERADGNKTKAFTDHAPWKRIIVFISGALFNLISALILITIFFIAYGDIMPTVAKIYDFTDGREQVLMADDVVLEVNGESVYTIGSANEFVKMLNKSGNTANLKIMRDGKEMMVVAERGNYSYEDDSGATITKTGYGISYGFTNHKFSFFASIGRAFVFCFKVVGVLFATIGGVITGALGVSESLGGTVTAITSIMEISRGGFGNIMYMVCILSATIGVTNLLPIPALDGSKVVFTSIEWARGKPINRKIENIIHMVGFALLICLTITLDLMHFLS